MARNIDERFKTATGCDTEKHKNYRFCEYCEVLVPKSKQQILTDLLEMAEDSWTREQLYQSTKPGVTVNSIKAVPVEAIRKYFGGKDE